MLEFLDCDNGRPLNAQDASRDATWTCRSLRHEGRFAGGLLV